MPRWSFISVAVIVMVTSFFRIARADWIDAFFSEKAEIDSIERFLVITDVKDSTFFGRGIAPAGDINQDGMGDVLICRSWTGQSYTDSNCYMFYSGEPVESGFQRKLAGLGRFTENIGDVNSDGYADFGSLTTPLPSFELHMGGPAMDNVADLRIGVLSIVPRSADLDSDGNPEIPLSINVNGGFVNIYDIGADRDTIPEYVIPDTATNFGVNLAVGDINGDAFPDLAVAAYLNRDTAFVKFYWDGPQFDTIADYEIHSTASRFGKVLVPIPDFNDDGYDDIFISGASSDRYGVYFGGPSFDDQLDIVVNWGTLFGPTAAAPAGDINNDGYPDLLVGYTERALFVNEVYLYLGGPDADSLVDVYIEGVMIPGGQVDFGYELAGLGDFNGDGIDDFAAHSVTQSGCCWTAEVNFFAGWDSRLTDVPVDDVSILPQTFVLHQNYPNPFNSSTTISFELGRRSSVRLSVENVLGKRVATLIDTELGPGRHSIGWGGLNSEGEQVSSGVYFYRIQTEDASQVKKMLLLK